MTDRDEPIRLRRKTTIFGYPSSVLYTEYRRGNLEVIKAANKLYVTRSAVLAMGELLKCATAKERGSGLRKGQGDRPSITSETDRIRQAQAAALIASERLRKPSHATSQNTRAPTPTSATSEKSSSRMS